MYKIIKCLNNNAVLAKKFNDEVILLGKGIGFGKKPNQIITINHETRIYHLTDGLEMDEIDVFNRTDPIFFEIANNIVENAQQKFSDFDSRILIPLADHISFSIKRIKEKIDIINPFKTDIKLLFEEEYKIALEAKDDILLKTGIEINEDEVAFITLHIHSVAGKKGTKVEDLLQVNYIIRDSIEKMEADFNVDIKKNSLFYLRLMTHMKYLLMRIEKDEKLDICLNDYVKSSFEYSFALSKDICDKIAKHLNASITPAEIGYLAIHLERIKNDSLGIIEENNQ